MMLLGIGISATVAPLLKEQGAVPPPFPSTPVSLLFKKRKLTAYLDV